MMKFSKSLSLTASDRAELKHRLRIEHLFYQPSENPGEDIIQGLNQTPKTLPPQYFYDDRGSLLFEKICELPEYYLTRTETAILKQCALEIAQLTGPCEVVELGSGSSTKTRILLNAYQKLGYPLRYLPIDVSGGILETSAYQLLTAYPTLEVHGLVSTYEVALQRLEPSPLQTRMICFVGSTLGNLNSQECDVFFSQITQALQPGEFFLLGIDLHKSKDVLEPAYNDAQGVTAAFNLNILQHLNRRFQGNFDLEQFQHWAFYNEAEHQIEMHLKSLRSQTVKLQSLNLTVSFAPEETIRTEISRKFDRNAIQEYLRSQGLISQHVWTDERSWFAVLLCQFKPHLM